MVIRVEVMDGQAKITGSIATPKGGDVNKLQVAQWLRERGYVPRDDTNGRHEVIATLHDNDQKPVAIWETSADDPKWN